MLSALVAVRVASSQWLIHSIVNSIIHGLIYGVIYKLLRGMGLGGALVTAVVGVAAVALIYKYLSRRQLS